MRAVQKDLEKIGAEGCYFLSIIKSAENITSKYIDPYATYLQAIAMHYLDDDCYVIDPAALIAMLTGTKWIVSKEARDYTAKDREVEILRFERVDTTKTWAHFVLGDGKGNVAYDPYGASMTVRSGALVSKRIFRRV